MIKYYLSKSQEQGHVDLNAISGNPNFGNHMQMASIVVKMKGDETGWNGRYNKLLQQQARQLCGAEAMYDKLAEIHTRLNASSELRQEIGNLLVAIDNIQVPV